MSEVDPSRPDIVAFMAHVAKDLAQKLPAPKDVFMFAPGSSAAVVDELLAKVLAGTKTGTCSWPIPEPRHWDVGDLAVVLNSKGEPNAVMRTISLTSCRFGDVTEDFALSEDEGDYEAWRQGHIAYFKRDKDAGHRFNEDAVVLCERFEVIYPSTQKSHVK